jgi:hypothetical protein
MEPYGGYHPRHAIDQKAIGKRDVDHGSGLHRSRSSPLGLVHEPGEQ